IHQPEMLILDEPTSGVDPIARDAFWRMLVELSRDDGVTIFISTHLMNEAERCDRISLMHAGKVLATGTPAALMKERGAQTLNEAFIGYLEDAIATASPADDPAIARELPLAPPPEKVEDAGLDGWRRFFDPRCMCSCARRE